MTASERSAGLWRRHLVPAFTQNLALKASALLLAVVLWFVVAAREPTENVVGVRFAPEMDSSLVLRDPPAPIRALVVGRPNEILKLSNAPLVIRRPIAGDAPDTLALSLRGSDVEVPEGVEVLVRDVQPREIVLHFETSVTRKVPVRSSLVARPTFEMPNMPPVRFSPDSVTVSGPRRAVARIRFVSTRADTVAMDTLPHLVDLDTTGTGVIVKPPQVKAAFALPQRLRR